MSKAINNFLRTDIKTSVGTNDTIEPIQALNIGEP